MSEENNFVSTTHGLHGVPGDEAIAAEEAVPAVATIMKPDTSSSDEDKDDYNSQPEDKAGLGNFWVGSLSLSLSLSLYQPGDNLIYLDYRGFCHIVPVLTYGFYVQPRYALLALV